MSAMKVGSGDGVFTVETDRRGADMVGSKITAEDGRVFRVPQFPKRIERVMEHDGGIQLELKNGRRQVFLEAAGDQDEDFREAAVDVDALIEAGDVDEQELEAAFLLERGGATAAQYAARARSYPQPGGGIGSSKAEPIGNGKGRKYPPGFQHIRNALIAKGMPVGKASAIAYSQLRRWAKGGGKVKKSTRVKAAKVVGQLDAGSRHREAGSDSVVEMKYALKGHASPTVPLGEWLKVRGDHQPIIEDLAQIREAAQRAVSGRGPLLARSHLDQRVLDQLTSGAVVRTFTEAGVSAGSQITALDFTPTERQMVPEATGGVFIQLPPERGVMSSILAEGETIGLGEVTVPRKVSGMDLTELQEAAREQYDSTMAPTQAGRAYLSSAGRMELTQLVSAMSSVMHRGPCGHLVPAGATGCPVCAEPLGDPHTPEQRMGALDQLVRSGYRFGRSTQGDMLSELTEAADQSDASEPLREAAEQLTEAWSPEARLAALAARKKHLQAHGSYKFAQLHEMSWGDMAQHAKAADDVGDRKSVATIHKYMQEYGGSPDGPIGPRHQAAIEKAHASQMARPAVTRGAEQAGRKVSRMERDKSMFAAAQIAAKPHGGLYTKQKTGATSWHLKHDAGGRAVIDGEHSGHGVGGYQTINGKWLAYRDDEQGWSNSTPSTSPADAIKEMHKRLKKSNLPTTRLASRRVAGSRVREAELREAKRGKRCPNCEQPQDAMAQKCSACGHVMKLEKADKNVDASLPGSANDDLPDGHPLKPGKGKGKTKRCPNCEQPQDQSATKCSACGHSMKLEKADKQAEKRMRDGGVDAQLPGQDLPKGHPFEKDKETADMRASVFARARGALQESDDVTLEESRYSPEFHNLGPSGRQRSVKSMGDDKLLKIAKHHTVHPDLRKRVRAELRDRGVKYGAPSRPPNVPRPRAVSRGYKYRPTRRINGHIIARKMREGDDALAAELPEAHDFGRHDPDGLTESRIHTGVDSEQLDSSGYGARPGKIFGHWMDDQQIGTTQQRGRTWKAESYSGPGTYHSSSHSKHRDAIGALVAHHEKSAAAGARRAGSVPGQRRGSAAATTRSAATVARKGRRRRQRVGRMIESLAEDSFRDAVIAEAARRRDSKPKPKCGHTNRNGWRCRRVKGHPGPHRGTGDQQWGVDTKDHRIQEARRPGAGGGMLSRTRREVFGGGMPGSAGRRSIGRVQPVDGGFSAHHHVQGHLGTFGSRVAAVDAVQSADNMQEAARGNQKHWVAHPRTGKRIGYTQQALDSGFHHARAKKSQGGFVTLGAWRTRKDATAALHSHARRGGTLLEGRRRRMKTDRMRPSGQPMVADSPVLVHHKGRSMEVSFMGEHQSDPGQVLVRTKKGKIHTIPRGAIRAVHA